jgi:hypothetical protein
VTVRDKAWLNFKQAPTKKEGLRQRGKRKGHVDSIKKRRLCYCLGLKVSSTATEETVT